MSFGQEMKDFMAAWQTVTDSGSKKKANEIDQAKAKADQEYKAAMLKLRQDEVALKHSASAGASGFRAAANSRAAERQAWAKEKQEAWKADREAAIKAGQEPPAPPAEDLTDTADESAAASDIPDWGSDPIAEQANGGLVKRYEAGGAVTPDAPVTDEAPLRPKVKATVGAIPTSPAPAAPAGKPIMVGANTTGGAGATTDAAPPQAAPDPHASEIVLKGAKDALGAVGKDYITKLAQKPSATGGAGGVEALPQEDLNTIMKTALDGGKVDSHLEGMVALSAAWNSNIKPEAREKLAMGILKTQQLQSQALGGFAEERLKAGDLPAFCKFINDACGRFPTDHKFEVQEDPKFGLIYHVYDSSGKVVEKGRAPMEKAWELTESVKNGSMFLKAVDAFHRGATEKAAAPDKYNAALEGVTSAYTAASKALEDLKLAQSTDGGDTEAAQRKAVAARKALDVAEDKVRAAAKTAGVKTLNSDLRQARKVDEVMAAPSAIPEEMGPPTPPPVPDDRSFIERNMPTALGGREAPTKTMSSDQLAKAKAAIAGGADPTALRDKLIAAGYSTEGL